jgi:hypothetical protein
MKHLAHLVLVLAAASASAGEGVLLRADFEPGQRLHYSWRLESTSTWSPQIEGTLSGTMTTEFDFVLAAEHVAANGNCDFALEGQKLESVAQGDKGGLGVRANPREASWLIGTHWTRPGPKTPLADPMTLSLGPRFNVTGSSGLEPIALYFLPSVDFRVWLALMTAPEVPVKPGTSWHQTFEIPVKDLGGRILTVDATYTASLEADATELVIGMGAELSLDDFDIDLPKTGTVHVVHGTYSVEGSTRWDLERGVPLEIEAGQSISAQADRPRTTFTSEATSRMTLDR